MHIKLLLKQSFRDFWSKLSLYLTFTLFLILTISVSLGMVSFSDGFKNNFSQTIGSHRVNANIEFRKFLPAWVEENELQTNDYVMKEKREDEHGYLYNFLDELVKNEKSESNKPLNLEEKDLELLTLGIGYWAGNAFQLETDEVLKDEVLNKYFNQDPHSLKKYNQNILVIRKVLNQNYQATNLGKVDCYLFSK